MAELEIKAQGDISNIDNDVTDISDINNDVIDISNVINNINNETNNVVDNQTNNVNNKTNNVNNKTKNVNNQTNNQTKCENDNYEVFHISNNLYSYDEARDMCEKYDSRLASYSEIERAYEQGANWCSYGWSKDQLALFPTQQAVYNELKKIPNHEHDCGRPGINGGYIKNRNVRFGVNCYGKRPKPTKKDKKYMHSINHSPALNNKNNNKNQDQDPNIIAPFNKDKWSKFQ